MKKVIIIVGVLIIAAAAVYGVAIGSPHAPASDAPAGNDRYTDSSGFSFAVPAGYTVTAADEPGAKTVFVQKKGSAGVSRVQIYVTPYDEPIDAFGPARIKKDLPNLDLSRAQVFDIAGGHGVSFDDSAGHEVWFVVRDQLYQITAPGSEDATVQEIITTFTSA